MGELACCRIPYRSNPVSFSYWVGLRASVEWSMCPARTEFMHEESEESEVCRSV